MILTKCPLRLSLVGGSTDLKEFVEWNGKGSVVSFPCNLYVYINLHENNRGKFFINYSKNEEVNNLTDIKNDVAREALMWFDQKKKLKPLSISFNSDVYTDGSGLGASSAYMIALIKALCMHTDTVMSAVEMCQLAHDLECKFNPLTGYQDPYGCGMPNLKRMDFIKDRPFPEFYYFDSELLNKYTMSLVHTNVSRSSTKILKSLDLKKCKKLLKNVEEMTTALENGDDVKFTKEINAGWQVKKETSPQIMTRDLIKIEEAILEEISLGIESFRLCGAGGGGYFLVFTQKSRSLWGSKILDRDVAVQVKLDEDGVTGVRF